MTDDDGDKDDIKRKFAAIIRDIDPLEAIPPPTAMEALGLAELLKLLATRGYMQELTVQAEKSKDIEHLLRSAAMAEGFMYLCKVSSILTGSKESQKVVTMGLARADQARTKLAEILERKMHDEEEGQGEGDPGAGGQE